MKAYQFYKLESTVSSLTASTLIKFYYGGVAVTVDGRCSPYLSHRTVTFSASATAVGNALFIENNAYALVLGDDVLPSDRTALEQSTGFVCDVVEEQIPSSLVEGLLREAARYLSGKVPWGDGGLIHAAFAVPAAVDWERVVDSDGISAMVPVFRKLAVCGEPVELAEFRESHADVLEEEYDGYQYVYVVADADDGCEDLEPVDDGEWHFVPEAMPRRVRCTVGWGWYRKVEAQHG